MRVILFILLTSAPPVHATNCATLILRYAAAGVSTVLGKEYTEEGRWIRDQLIARGPVGDDTLAHRWAEREDRSHITWGPGVDYWGPSSEVISFIQTIPHWKLMTNAQLRPYLFIEYVRGVAADFGYGDEVTTMVVAYADRPVTDYDLRSWDTAFPTKPIPPALRALLLGTKPKAD